MREEKTVDHYWDNSWHDIRFDKPPADTLILTLYDDRCVGTGSFPDSFDWAKWEEAYADEYGLPRITHWACVPELPKQ